MLQHFVETIAYLTLPMINFLLFLGLWRVYEKQQTCAFSWDKTERNYAFGERCVPCSLIHIFATSF